MGWKGLSLTSQPQKLLLCQCSTSQVTPGFLPLNCAPLSRVLRCLAPPQHLWSGRPCITVLLRHPRCCGRGTAAGWKCRGVGVEHSVLQ